MPKKQYVQLTGELVVVKGGTLMKASEVSVQETKIITPKPSAPIDLSVSLDIESFHFPIAELAKKTLQANPFGPGKAFQNFVKNEAEDEKLARRRLYTYDGTPVMDVQEVSVEHPYMLDVTTFGQTMKHMYQGGPSFATVKGLILNVDGLKHLFSKW